MVEPAAVDQASEIVNIHSVLADLVLAVLLLAVIPAATGLVGVHFLGFGAYAVIASGAFSLIAWTREHRHFAVSRQTLAAAAMVRLILVLVIGGFFYAAGLLLH